MNNLSPFQTMYIITAFVFQIILITHFSLRKWHFSTAIRYGWIVYALSLPAALVSIVLLLQREAWYFWLGGFIYLVWASVGYWIEYVKGIEWRNPIRWSVLGPYITLYLATVMFYWWPLARIFKPLWYLYALAFLISTVLNVTSHKQERYIPLNTEFGGTQ